MIASLYQSLSLMGRCHTPGFGVGTDRWDAKRVGALNERGCTASNVPRDSGFNAANSTPGATQGTNLANSDGAGFHDTQSHDEVEDDGDHKGSAPGCRRGSGPRNRRRALPH